MEGSNSEDISSNMDGSNNLMIAKFTAMTVLGLSSFFIGISPIKLTKLIKMPTNGEKNLIISLFLCFGGGVLLFTTFLHLQPEVRESFSRLEAKKVLPTIGHGISIAELVFCLGFFLVYLIEELVHIFLDKKIDDHGLQRSLSARYKSQKDTNLNLTIPRVTLNKIDDGNISYISTSNKELLNSQSTVGSDKNSNHSSHNNDSHHHHHHHHIDGSVGNSFSGLLAVLALSFHAVFEGLAVGLEGSVQKVWYLFAAIATHKLVIGFCVGIELVTSKTKTLLVILYIGTFAIVTPLGIALGIILSESSNNAQEDITALVLQGMAAGTLLYVVFFEVLARERDNKHSGVWQLLAILAGFAVMFCLQMLTGHEHSHGGNEVHMDHHQHELYNLSTEHNHDHHQHHHDDHGH